MGIHNSSSNCDSGGGHDRSSSSLGVASSKQATESRSSSSNPAMGNDANSSLAAVSSSRVVDKVAWLVLFGRFVILLWLPQIEALFVRVSEERDMVACIAALQSALRSHIHLRVVECVVVCRDWLCSSNTLGQLSAAGYNCQPLVQLLLDSVIAHQDAATTAVTAAATAPTAVGECQTAVDWVCKLATQLQALGLALTTLPIDCACNDPTCGSLFGKSEQGEVMGSKRLCGGCRMAR
jgi:hypothetical protein